MADEQPIDEDALIDAVRRRQANLEFGRELQKILEDDWELLRRLAGQ